MTRAPSPIIPTATTAKAGPVVQAEHQAVRPGDPSLRVYLSERLTALALKVCPHPDLSPQDLAFLRDHPELWVHTDVYTLERQQRIIEGWRQLLAIQKGTEVCPATGGVCGQVGQGPHGVHNGCVPLSYN